MEYIMGKYVFAHAYIYIYYIYIIFIIIYVIIYCILLYIIYYTPIVVPEELSGWDISTLIHINVIMAIVNHPCFHDL